MDNTSDVDNSDIDNDERDNTDSNSDYDSDVDGDLISDIDNVELTNDAENNLTETDKNEITNEVEDGLNDNLNNEDREINVNTFNRNNDWTNDMTISLRNDISSKKSTPFIRNKLKGLDYNIEYKDDEKKNRKNNTGQPKRGPGRPCKAPKKDPIPRKGIVKAPLHPDDHIEFIYDKPLLLRKIFQLFKQLAVAQIQIIFRQNEILFYSQDHHKKTDCRVKIDTRKINLYYCKSELEVGVSAKDIECILNTVNKEYSSIIITSNVNNTQKNIIINLENSLQADEIHTIELVGSYKHMENEREFIDGDYAIELKFPWSTFKKTICDIKTMTSQMSITQMDRNKPLSFEFLKSNKKVSTKHVYKNSSTIELKSKVKEDTGFRVDIKVDYLKPIASSQITDHIIILVDENKKIMTCSYLDNHTIEIRTLTEIIDNRPTDQV